MLFVSVIYNAVDNYKSQFLRSQKNIQPKKADEFLGFTLDTLNLVEGKVKKGQFFSSIMTDFNVSYDKVMALAHASKEIFDVRKMMTGSKYYFLCSNESKDPKVFIYEKNPAEFMVFHLDSSLSVQKMKKKTQRVERKIEGNISSSLYESIQKSGGSAELAVHLSEIYAWTVDFYRLQKDDSFEILFDENFVDSTSLGIESIKAARFTHNGETFQAFYYNQDGKTDYFDDKGNSLKRAFLKSPVKFSRISSHFNLKRFHPVQRRVKAHLGTDYAAPHGTPILAVGNGVILEAKHGHFNGNYVKIKHNSTYTTQYLHMSKFASGIKSGSYVKQGQVIGYVGSTGLASGPHVCFRFWKNGKQVNHLSEKFIPSDPIPKNQLASYLQTIDPLVKKLNSKEAPALLVKK